MTKTNISAAEAMRDAFEEWATSLPERRDISRDVRLNREDGYWNVETQKLWLCWQACASRALPVPTAEQEAPKVADAVLASDEQIRLLRKEAHGSQIEGHHVVANALLAVLDELTQRRQSAPPPEPATPHAKRADCPLCHGGQCQSLRIGPCEFLHAPRAEQLKVYVVQEDDGEKIYDAPPPLCDYEVREQPQEPVAWMFHVRYDGKGRSSWFAAIDYHIQVGETLISKQPLIYAAPSPDPAAPRAERQQEPVADIYERLSAIREGARNRAEELYFNAREHLSGLTDTKICKVFRDGFDRGYNAAPATHPAANTDSREQEGKS